MADEESATKPASEPREVAGMPGTWVVEDMGPADDDTVIPLAAKSCGGCRYEGGAWGFLKGLALGLGVRTCSIRQCWVAGGRVYCHTVTFTETCQLPNNPHSGWPMWG
jgi:hypothetical protein